MFISFTIIFIYVTVWWSISHLTAHFQMHMFIASNALRKRMRKSSLDVNGFDLYGHWPQRDCHSSQRTFFLTPQQPPVGQGLLTVEASRSHSVTPHSVGLLWTSDQPAAETSTWQHTTLTTDRHPCPRRDSNPQSQRAAADPRLRPRGHWDRPKFGKGTYRIQIRYFSAIPTCNRC